MFSALRASPPARWAISSCSSAGISDAECRRAAAHDLEQCLVRVRLQLVDLRAREQRGVHLEVRVLGRRADQRDEPLLDARQQRVLLRLVEAVDLVEEQDRALTARAEPLARTRQHLTHVRHRRRNRRQLFERRSRSRRRRFARASSSPNRAARRGSSTERGPARSRVATPDPARPRAPARRNRRALPAVAAARAARRRRVAVRRPR